MTQRMNLKQLFTDDGAVSPVIGVILMVAITVILAAVIGTFVLGLGDQVGNNAPQASFSFDFTDNSNDGQDTLEIVHNGGAKVKGARLDIKATDIQSTAGGGNSKTSLNWKSDLGGGTDVTAGDSVTIADGNDGSQQLNGQTVRLIWTSESGDSSAEIGTWSGPDA